MANLPSNPLQKMENHIKGMDVYLDRLAHAQAQKKPSPREIETLSIMLRTLSMCQDQLDAWQTLKELPSSVKVIFSKLKEEVPELQNKIKEILREKDVSILFTKTTQSPFEDNDPQIRRLIQLGFTEQTLKKLPIVELAVLRESVDLLECNPSLLTWVSARSHEENWWNADYWQALQQAHLELTEIEHELALCLGKSDPLNPSTIKSASILKQNCSAVIEQIQCIHNRPGIPQEIEISMQAYIDKGTELSRKITSTANRNQVAQFLRDAELSNEEIARFSDKKIELLLDSENQKYLEKTLFFQHAADISDEAFARILKYRSEPRFAEFGKWIFNLKPSCLLSKDKVVFIYESLSSEKVFESLNKLNDDELCILNDFFKQDKKNWIFFQLSNDIVLFLCTQDNINNLERFLQFSKEDQLILATCNLNEAQLNDLFENIDHLATPDLQSMLIRNQKILFGVIAQQVRLHSHLPKEKLQEILKASMVQVIARPPSFDHTVIDACEKASLPPQSLVIAGCCTNDGSGDVVHMNRLAEVLNRLYPDWKFSLISECYKTYINVFSLPDGWESHISTDVDLSKIFDIIGPDALVLLCSLPFGGKIWGDKKCKYFFSLFEYDISWENPKHRQDLPYPSHSVDTKSIEFHSQTDRYAHMGLGTDAIGIFTTKGDPSLTSFSQLECTHLKEELLQHENSKYYTAYIHKPWNTAAFTYTVISKEKSSSDSIVICKLGENALNVATTLDIEFLKKQGIRAVRSILIHPDGTREVKETPISDTGKDLIFISPPRLNRHDMTIMTQASDTCFGCTGDHSFAETLSLNKMPIPEARGHKLLTLEAYRKVALAIYGRNSPGHLYLQEVISFMSDQEETYNYHNITFNYLTLNEKKSEQLERIGLLLNNPECIAQIQELNTFICKHRNIEDQMRGFINRAVLRGTVPGFHDLELRLRQEYQSGLIDLPGIQKEIESYLKEHNYLA